MSTGEEKSHLWEIFHFILVSYTSFVMQKIFWLVHENHALCLADESVPCVADEITSVVGLTRWGSL